MAFIPQDLYLTSGLVGSINNWQETVTKFDSSTFYNWEQDNLPVYDLEDRTDYIWERIGYPIQDGFSGIPGKMFVVSSNYSFPGGSDSSGIIFKNLSSVINTLPNPITYPIIIEVASFGNLGELNLNNIKIDDSCPGAGLEIVNRAFARSKFGAAATPSAIYQTDPSVSSLMVKEMFHNASAMALSAVVLSATTDPRLNSNNRSWVVNYPYGNQSSPVTINSLLSQKPIFSFKDASFDQSLATNKFAIAEYGNTEDPTITAYDIAITDSIAGGTISRPAIQNNSNVAMLSYGNFLSNVKISNCDGPIFIRNFLVDGALDTSGGSLAHTTETGFNVINSDVTLENCMSVRCSKYGFKVINSNVEVRRAIVGARIYDVSSTTTARKTDTNGIGLYAENSLINFVPVSTAYVQYSGVDLISQFAFNDVGIELNNSKIMGGNSITAAFTATNGPTMIQTMYNTKTGLIMNNSIWDHKGGLEAFNNSNGIIANNSQLNIPLLTVEYNQNKGLQAYNCDIKFNPELIQPAVGNSYNNTQIGEAYKQFNFHLNGQHVLLDHSNLRYPESSSLPTKVGNLLAGSSFGLYSLGASKGHLPAFEVRNNSNADLAHSKIRTYQTTATDITQPGFGTAISVHDNSKVCFKASIGNGTTYGPTILVGPQSLTAQKGSAVAYASRNSEIEFNGNTLIAQGGVDVLAEDNSVINFNPHRKVGKNLDVSSWNLDSTGNHTRVELHAIRACLVVDNNSVLNMEDLGHYGSYWSLSLLGSNDYNNNDVLGMGAYTSAGYMQFYPNPEDTNLLTGTNLVPAASYSYTATNPGYFLTDYTNANSETNIAGYSKGGVCVKAQRGSKVNALNVNFAAGWYNTSGQFFDTSSGNCELLRIWNICQGSELEAAHLSVSSTYPSLTGYYGPSAVYLSGAGVPASGAPSGTPDTSSLSVLDYYGVSSTRAGTNYGPFRLFFSPNTQAKMLGYVSGTGTGGAAYLGAPYQMLAQGYNPSGNLIGSSAFNAIYSGISTSAFYYVSAMLDPGYRNRIRLDESAADTFANARHNAIGKSGRIPLVTIYRSFTSPGGQQYDADLAGYGKGFKSAEIFDLRRYS